MVVNGRGRHHADATVAMLRVVPIEEALAMGAVSLHIGTGGIGTSKGNPDRG